MSRQIGKRREGARRYPMKRMAIPEEIGATALFLCSAAGGYASGAIFDINGGTHFH
jgi:NAD(P)-dependent dehydrogenase (short-subunit alcohol dehydrogenase family)